MVDALLAEVETLLGAGAAASSTNGADEQLIPVPGHQGCSGNKASAATVEAQSPFRTSELGG